MQRLQICRTKLRSSKYRRFPWCRCFDYLQITTGLTSVSMFGLSSSFGCWLFFLSFWKHTTHRIQKQGSQNRNGRTLNNTTSIQESCKDGWWWCSQVSVWTHKTHLSLSQKGGVYDSLQCLQPKTGSYFLKWRLLPQSSSEQFLLGQGRLAAPWSERSLTRRKVPLVLQFCATKLDHFVHCKQGYV